MSDATPELPEGLAEFVQDGRLFHRAGAAAQRVQLALYRLIAAGRPVDRDGLALAVGHDSVEVAEILAAIPASNFLYDSGGQIVGFRGLGQVPTRHHLGFAGKRLFAWCAFDCLFLASLLGGTIEVASACPTSGAEIRLTVTPEGVTSAGPESTVLSFVTPAPLGMRAELREVFCAKVHFFAGPEPAEAWRANHPDASILTLDQGFELARLRNAAGFGAVLGG
ncbi:MAG: organomercurial lyase [Alphaproteobacteria bacterium]